MVSQGGGVEGVVEVREGGCRGEWGRLGRLVSGDGRGGDEVVRGGETLAVRAWCTDVLDEIARQYDALTSSACDVLLDSNVYITPLTTYSFPTPTPAIYRHPHGVSPGQISLSLSPPFHSINSSIPFLTSPSSNRANTSFLNTSSSHPLFSLFDLNTSPAP